MKFWNFLLEDPKTIIALGFVLGLIALSFVINEVHWLVLTLWGLGAIGIIGSRYTEYKRNKIDKDNE